MEQEQTVSSQVEPVSPTPQVPKIKNSLVLIMSILLIITVGIAGLFYFQIQKLSKELSKYQIQLTPTPTATFDPTANWKTYQDEQVSFIYPSDWEVQEPTVLSSRTVVEFKYNNTPLFTFTHQANYNNGTGKPFSSLEEYLGIRSNLATEIKVDNLAAKLISAQGDGGHTISYKEMLMFTPNKSSMVSLYYSYPYYDRPETEHVFDQILSTFKFLGSISPSPTTTSKACTLEVKVCPDGSSVGRTGPNCEFAPCPQ